MFEQMGGGDIGHVERRVLAHQHHVDGGEIERGDIAESEVIAVHSAQVERPRPRHHPALVERQIAGEIVKQGMAAGARLERQREGRVGVDIDRLDRVHLNGDGERGGHGGAYSSTLGRRIGSSIITTWLTRRRT